MSSRVEYFTRLDEFYFKNGGFMAIIEIKDASFSYNGDVPALSGINLAVDKREFLVIMGPNGSGKTTLMNLISGVRNPDRGEVLLEGKHISSMNRKDIAKKIAYLPQHISIDFPFTVRQIVLMGRFAYLKGLGIEGKEDVAIAERAMEMTGVLTFADRMIHQLSGGERQRVFIAQAITAEPEIMMLDEPISSLDVKYQVQIMDLLKSLNEEKGITIITTLHDLNFAGFYAKSLMLLKKGVVHYTGSPEKIIDGESIRNVFDVDVELYKYSEEMSPLVIPFGKRRVEMK